MKTKFKKNFWKIILVVLVIIMLYLILKIFWLKPTFYTITLEQFNGEIKEFEGAGIIVDNHDKDFISFTVEKIIHNDPEYNDSTSLINSKYETIRIYVGNDSSKKLLQYYQINFHLDGVLKNFDHNNIVNDLIKNKDNIYFCFVKEYESKEESCLKANLQKHN